LRIWREAKKALEIDNIIESRMDGWMVMLHVTCSLLHSLPCRYFEWLISSVIGQLSYLVTHTAVITWQ